MMSMGTAGRQTDDDERVFHSSFANNQATDFKHAKADHGGIIHHRDMQRQYSSVPLVRQQNRSSNEQYWKESKKLKMTSSFLDSSLPLKRVLVPVLGLPLVLKSCITHSWL